MKKYVKTIETLISRQIVSGKTNLIRIEGVEYPLVYQALYKMLKNKYAENLHAALSVEKFSQFMDAATPETSPVLHWFVNQGLVLENDTLTWMRNQAANEQADKTSVYLLMGAEAVQDRGGLEDFSSIMTSELVEDLSSDYSAWFKDTFDSYGFDEAHLKTINGIYKTLFSAIRVDAMQLSRFVDALDDMAFDSPRDIIGIIYGTLDQYWNIPRIENRLKLDVESKADIGLLNSAIGFIQRKEEIVKRIQSKKLEKQLNNYVEAHEIDREAAFPVEMPCFSSFGEFVKALRDFGAGKNQSELRDKFISFDYSIIAEILGIKTDAPTVSKSGKVTLHGDPLEAYGYIVFDMAERFHKDKEAYPETIEISVEEVRLSQCTASDDDEDNDTTSIASAYSELVSMLGGIVGFLNDAHFVNNDIELEIGYVDGVDPFTMQAYYDQYFMRTKTTRNWDDMCHIDFEVIADDGELKVKYRWIFSPKAPWKKSFSLLDDNGEDAEVPSLLVSDRLESCISCEDDDEFGAQLENCNPKNETEGQRNAIRRFFESYGILDKFNLLCGHFSDWARTIHQKGFFNCRGQLANVVSSYGSMIRVAYENFQHTAQEERNKLYLIVDSFTILDAQSILTNGTIRAAIVPAYHPLTLEKIAAQCNFLRDGYLDMYAQLKKGSFKKGLEELHTMAAVAGSLDAMVSTSQQYLSCHGMHGYHAVYLPKEQGMALLTSGSALDTIIGTEEDDGDKTVPANSEIIYRNIMDYIHTFPSRMDGLTVSLINPYDMHHVIAAMQVIDKKLQEEGAEAVINLNIICIDAQRNSSGYLKRWLDNFFSEEKHIHVNTFLRYAFFDGGGRVSNLDSMLRDTDICFLYDLMEMQAIQFKKMGVNAGHEGDTVQFPMVRIPDVISRSAGQQRSISNSQFQFRNSEVYTQLVHVIGYPFDAEGTYRTMFALEMPDKIKNILDTAHACSRWTVCIDQAIDRDLIKDRGNKIIGFSTGDGDFGDLNVTVSAQADILDDIQELLEKKLFERFPSWNDAKRKAAAKFCIDSTSDMDGIRVLKALNPNDYNIHSYLAYILTLQCLMQGSSDSVQRVLVNLDAYMHWFDKSKIGSISESESRPDLLLLDIPKTDDLADPSKPLHIRARVIECKMGKDSVSQLISAKEQVVHGYEVLKNKWNPDSTSITRRHWFNQLYRVLVFSKIKLKDNQEEYPAVEQKLQNILEGKFDIEWECAVYAYWLDQDGSEQKVYVSNQDGVDVTMNVAGQLYIQKMLMPAERRDEEVRYEVQAENEGTPTDDIDEQDTVAPMDDESPIDVVVVPDIPAVDNIPEQYEETSAGADSEAGDAGEEEPATEQAEEVVETPHESVETVPTETEGNRDISGVRMRLGEDIHTQTSFYWEFGHPELNNRHLLINGNSGCGKTYAIQTLLMEQAKQGISSVIFDYTAGFTATKLDPAFKTALGNKIQQRVVRAQKLPVNPFQKHDIKIDEDLYIPEDNTDIATKIANIFQKVYAFGDQQKSSIYSAIMNGLKKYGDQMSFTHMAEELEEIGGSTAERVLSKIRPFIDLNPFTLEEPFNWGGIRDSDGIVYIIQLTGYSSDVKLLLTEILLWDIWSYCEKNGDESRPFTVVLDEAQNLDHSAASPSAKILTEGRKFGISGWYATQFMKPQLSDDEIQRLQQAGQKLYFCPPDEGVMTVAKNIDITSQGSKVWAEKLKKLKKGECVTCGGMVKNGKWSKYEPRIIKITSFQERLR